MVARHGWDRRGVLVTFGWFGSSVRKVEDGRVARAARSEREVVRKVDTVKQSKREPIKIEPTVNAIEKSERAEREQQIPLFSASPIRICRRCRCSTSRSSRSRVIRRKHSKRFRARSNSSSRISASMRRLSASIPGPVITRFELQPAPGIKGSQISNLDKDIARGLSVISVRVVDVIPGKSVIGLEIPNANREIVYLSEILRSEKYDGVKSPLALALGKDIGGRPVVVDLQKMPHLLVAGTTGSGKSVALNAMVLSLLYKATARDVRMIMIDPKMLELSVYEGIPHLLAPVVTDMKEAANALRWCVAEMERRYKLMAAVGVRNLAGFNKKVKDEEAKGRPLSDPLFKQPEGTIEADAGTDARTAAVRRRDHRRVRRHDDDRRQEGRRIDRAARAEGARGRRASDPRHAAAVGRCDHRLDQGEYPDAHRVPGVEQDRFAHDSRSVRRGDPARSRRHALSAARHGDARARARRIRRRRRGAQGRRAFAQPGQAGIHRRRVRRRAVARRWPRDRRIGLAGRRRNAEGDYDELYDQAVASSPNRAARRSPACSAA